MQKKYRTRLSYYEQRNKVGHDVRFLLETTELNGASIANSFGIFLSFFNQISAGYGFWISIRWENDESG